MKKVLPQFHDPFSQGLLAAVTVGFFVYSAQARLTTIKDNKNKKKLIITDMSSGVPFDPKDAFFLPDSNKIF
jgi:hypothetical protein